MPSFQTGKLGKAKVGATDVNIEGWNFDPQAEELETTHSGGAGYKTVEDGIKSGSGSLTATWDVDADPSASPPNFVPGTKLVNLVLYIGDPANNNTIDCASALVVGMPIVSEVKGLVKYTMNFVTDGPYTMPS